MALNMKSPVGIWLHKIQAQLSARTINIANIYLIQRSNLISRRARWQYSHVRFRLHVVSWIGFDLVGKFTYLTNKTKSTFTQLIRTARGPIDSQNALSPGWGALAAALSVWIQPPDGLYPCPPVDLSPCSIKASIIMSVTPLRRRENQPVEYGQKTD